MVKRFISITLSLSFTLLAPQLSFAKVDKNAQQAEVPHGPRRHLATIVMAGLAGAVLGLSTLSFYGRPQDKLSNIAVGFAFGIISGTVYTTYKAAAEPKEFYSVRDIQPELWAKVDRPSVEFKPGTNFTFEF